MHLDEERRLLQQIKADPQQFGLLLDHYYEAIFGYIFRRVTLYDTARDLAAETFLKAFAKIHTFQWTGRPISAWLYKIATNEVNLYFRKEKYRPVSLHQLLDEGALPPFTDDETEREKLDRELAIHEEFVIVQQHLVRLPVKYQEVIALRYFEDKTNKEIAVILGKKEGTIKSLVSRGLEKLRQSIEHATENEHLYYYHKPIE